MSNNFEKSKIKSIDVQIFIFKLMLLTTNGMKTLSVSKQLILKMRIQVYHLQFCKR